MDAEKDIPSFWWTIDNRVYKSRGYTRNRDCVGLKLGKVWLHEARGWIIQVRYSLQIFEFSVDTRHSSSALTLSHKLFISRVESNVGISLLEFSASIRLLKIGAGAEFPEFSAFLIRFIRDKCQHSTTPMLNKRDNVMNFGNTTTCYTCKLCIPRTSLTFTLHNTLRPTPRFAWIKLAWPLSI